DARRNTWTFADLTVHPPDTDDNARGRRSMSRSPQQARIDIRSPPRSFIRVLCRLGDVERGGLVFILDERGAFEETVRCSQGSGEDAGIDQRDANASPRFHRIVLRTPEFNGSRERSCFVVVVE